MSSIIGDALRVSIFGQSHSPAIGCTIDGLPAGLHIDEEELLFFLGRRAPGRKATATARKEKDSARIICGIADGSTCGAPLTAIIENADARSEDYDELRSCPRPGHADLAAYVKYRNCHDAAGGGHFSGRLTAPLCIAGGIALQALKTQGISIAAHIASLGPEAIEDTPLDDMREQPSQAKAILDNDLPCISRDAALRMQGAILESKTSLDSIGGIIECAAYNVPAGLGDPMFDGIENRIARIAFGIPGVKGIEFGSGFASASLHGSQNNDPYRMLDGACRPVSNNAGGILGGITNGMPIIWKIAVKPTSSIGKPQQSVELTQGANRSLIVQGRHDPCIVPRAVPVAEAVCAISILDVMLENGNFDLHRLPDKRYR